MSLSYNIHSSVGTENVTQLDSKTYLFNYPCSDNTNCDAYEVHLAKGFY